MNKKRGTSILLSLALMCSMIITVMPLSAFAESTTTTQIAPASRTYKVRHIKQSLNGSYSDESMAEYESLTGKVGDRTNASANRSYSGFQALVPEQVEGLVIPIMDARRNNVYAGFYQSGQAVRPEAHLPLVEVLEIAGATNQPVTFVGETATFAEQIKDALPQAAIQSTLPDAVAIGRLGLDLPAQSIHDFVPNYLKRVEAEENWLKTHQESSDSYIQRL